MILSFFARALYPLYSSNHLQNYFGIVLYLFLAMALCSLLATLAYLFSLSSVQDSEKRSEYECGFEPFDSATRLPFDVHFYLVGILFLIFDVEIALLFPWVLGLRTSGWFGFYLMIGFIVLLGIGFLYEWKRGALIWPSRQQEMPYVIKTASLWVLFFESSIMLVVTTTVTIAGAAFGHIFDPYSALINAELGSVEVRQWVIEEINEEDAVIAASVKNLLLPLFGISSTGYVNAPTAKISNKFTLVLKKLTILLKKSNLKLNTWRFKTLADHFGAIRFAEQQLMLHKKTLNYYLQKIATIAGQMRSKHPYDEKVITLFENKNYETATAATKQYKNLVSKYKIVRAKLVAYQSKKKLVGKKSKIISIATNYLELKRKTIGIATTRESAMLRKSSVQLAKLTAQKKQKFIKKSNTLLGRVSAQKHSKFGAKVFRHKKALLPLVLVTESSSYFAQFFGDFLPEMTITVMLTAVLTFMAIELGQGRAKKELALESLHALKTGLSFVIALYLLQLIFGSASALFNGYLVVTIYTTSLKLLTVISGRFILSSSEQYIREHSRHLLEYPVVMTLAILFMVLLVGSSHLISAFLALVGFSLNLYVLVLFDATTAIAREAGIKYFYLSTVSSGLILYSIFLIFIVLGSGHIYEIGHFLATEAELLQTSVDLLQLAVTMLLVGLFFKLSAFPGHLWAAEVYEGSPDPITAFFMLPVKVAVLGFVVQLIATAFEPIAALWQPLMALSAAVSLVWGCVAALSEPKTKRFLAYASINQIGFLLMGLSSASLEGYRTTMFYLVLYAIMNVGFLVVFLHARRQDGRSLLYLTDFRGFGQRYVQHSWSIAMILLSMAGIPPLAGFFGKYYLLLHAQEQELYGLVIIGLATSLISTFYYLRLVKIMWFEGQDGMVIVSCTLTWQQTLALRLSEWTLWVFIVHSGAITYLLNNLTDAVIFFNTFYIK